MADCKDESLCTKCGICCYIALRDRTGKLFYTPFYCRYLDPVTKQCMCYDERFKNMKGCSNACRAVRFKVLPTNCPYTVDIEGYQGPDPDYRNSPFICSMVEKAIAAGPDEEGLYTIRGRKFALDESWTPETTTYKVEPS